eukprot:TRINITY_DN13508_c0_g1_i1.p1 TRINITY_DN13508_c0_g1~~TRINITY_DN13508_c0_g1_i1.p1  ORF type:complete len:401 (+),score=107.66 TRINITY_DN13508_c0_g1_i1:83-1285(+)
MRATRVQLRVQLRDLPGVAFQDKNGWSKHEQFQPAMPGFGSEAHVAADITVKHKWGAGLRVPHGATVMDVKDLEKAKSLMTGPKGLGDRVSDFMGIPSAEDTYTAAKWKVDRLARVDDAYKVENAATGVTNHRPKPRLFAASAMSGGERRGTQQNKWRNYLERIKGGTQDPLVRDPADQRKYAPTLEEEVSNLVRKADATAEQLRSKEPARPWEVNRDIPLPASEEEPRASLSQQVEPVNGAMAMSAPATAVWVYCWLNEWDTQVKVACPWDHKLLVHRCSAELPWALEQQWNSQEVARELVKDSCEDFFDMCKRKGYLQGDKMEAVVCINGFWQQRRGVVQGLNELRNKFDFTSVADITPIPVHEVELNYPVPPEPPKVAMFQCRVKAEDHQVTSIDGR